MMLCPHMKEITKLVHLVSLLYTLLISLNDSKSTFVKVRIT